MTTMIVLPFSGSPCKIVSSCGNLFPYSESFGIGVTGSWADERSFQMRAVLIVVDMLNDFFERSPVLAMQRARLVASANLLARGFRGRGLPVFWVRQEFAPDLHDAFPEMRAKNLSVTIAG